MEKAVQQFIHKHKLLRRNETVIVALSGGPDSVALLHFLWKKRKQYEIEVRACHLNHQLRGSESEGDMQFVQALCEERGIKLYCERLDVEQYAKQHKIGTQAAARSLRYRYFQQLVKEIPNSCIATGHHGDDQVETMMMRMIRGVNPLYSFGIPLARSLGKGRMIRPLLNINKEMIETYCEREQLMPRYDSSNDSLVYTRNRLRHQLLPILKSENEHIHLHMQRQNEWQEDDQKLLMKYAEDNLSSIILAKSDQNVTISRERFLVAALPLQRRMIHLILSYLCGKNSAKITSIHIEQIIELLEHEHPSNEVHVAETLFVRRDYERCHFFVPSIEKKEIQEMPLLPGGEASMYGWFFESFIANDWMGQEAHHQIVLDVDDLVFPLIIRNRQADDRIACRGMTGTKKVSRLFIDRKVPKHERDQWPILVNGDEEVLWVPFLHKSRRAQMKQTTKNKLVITCRHDGELLHLLNNIGGFLDVD